MKRKRIIPEGARRVRRSAIKNALRMAPTRSGLNHIIEFVRLLEMDPGFVLRKPPTCPPFCSHTFVEHEQARSKPRKLAIDVEHKLLRIRGRLAGDLTSKYCFERRIFMKRNTGFSIIAMMIGLVFVGAAPKAVAEEFYQGKTIRFLVGFAAGGGFDTYSRMIARHIGKHIPGHPSTVVENMTGAGSLVAANYLYRKADPDGLTIGNFIGPLVLQDALGNKAAQFDGRKFGWLGVPTPDSGVCVLTSASGINSVDEWFKAKQAVKLGGTAPGSTTDDVPKIIKAAIDLPIQMIEGYKGTSRIRVAAESGEIDGGCWAWESIKPTWTKALDSGAVRPVLQTMLESHPELNHVPLAIEYAKTDEARELLKIIDGAYGATARPYAVPPGIPHDRLELLQKAFMDTMKDPELLAESKKAQLEFKPIDGPKIAKIFAGFYEIKPAMKERLRQIVLPGKRPVKGPGA